MNTYTIPKTPLRSQRNVADRKPTKNPSLTNFEKVETAMMKYNSEKRCNIDQLKVKKMAGSESKLSIILDKHNRTTSLTDDQIKKDAK